MGRQFFISLVRLLRWLVPSLFRVAIFTIRCLAMSLVTWWVGVPNIVRRIAQLWLEAARMPIDIEPIFYRCACVVAFILVVLSWVVSAYITTWIVGLLLSWIV